MPAEAVHLTALARSIAEAPPALKGLLERNLDAARLGAVFVDLPYFVRFPVQAVLFALKLRLSASPWGDRFHVDAPQRVGIALLQQVRAAPHAQQEAFTAFALGYFSHLAVDTALHPLVNRLAARQVEREGRNLAFWHREVEKFQSILFHEELNGFDFMGNPAIARYISVPTRQLDEPAWRAWLDAALSAVLGIAPTSKEWTSFARGYEQYVRLLASFVGARVAPPDAKRRGRPLFYDTAELHFRDEFERAVGVSNRFVQAAFDWFEAGGDDPAPLLAVTGECSIDDPGQPARLRSGKVAQSA